MADTSSPGLSSSRYPVWLYGVLATLLGLSAGISGGFVHFRMTEARSVEDRQWSVIRQNQRDIAVLQHEAINRHGDPDEDED